ncbi:colanic acid biosynthesis glycosyl transferase WcaI [Mariniflexile fucanivorans]|uniref:Colanic acid biosynthesis glycosyl transferase WcaI n=1 Tax=Mariniflexile fucanivorans TaxID=264023 RepID=A0A4R1RKH2_9FLAO|nr:WcaI family glycosyltransferase [Mariniflexile fucanivorans]TCL66688.1 colanic acid biosynthesis glycosyl transferase WcaI [Mariniflexile fucanivorans]
MKKRILLIGYNFTPEPTGIGKYSGEMMYWLANKGYDCTVVTTYPYYPYWSVQEPYKKNKFWYLKEVKKFDSGGKMTVYRCPMYVPSNPSGKKRMLLDVSFMVSAFFQLVVLLFKKKCDTVITVVPSFQFGLLGYFYKVFKKAKTVYHIQDMQIEAAQDLNMISSPKVLNLLYKIEQFIFRNTDVITSISEKMVAKIEDKAKKQVLLFPNWSDTAFFTPLENKEILKTEFGFLPTDKVVLYSGAIGEKQGLESIIEAAAYFKKQPNIKFVICGSGPYKEKLQTMASNAKLESILFFPLQPMEKFNKFLNMADVHLVIQKAKASDLVMPSKLTTILSVGGLALITANSDSGLYALTKKYNMGVLVAAENQLALNTGIDEALLTSDRLTIMKNARNYAENYLDINKVMEAFEGLIIH